MEWVSAVADSIRPHVSATYEQFVLDRFYLRSQYALYVSLQDPALSAGGFLQSVVLHYGLTLVDDGIGAVATRSDAEIWSAAHGRVPTEAPAHREGQEVPVVALASLFVKTIRCPYSMLALSHTCRVFRAYFTPFRIRFLSIVCMFRMHRIPFDADNDPLVDAFQVDAVARVLYPFRVKLPAAAMNRYGVTKTFRAPVAARCTFDTHVVGAHKCDRFNTLDWPTLSGFGDGCIRDRFERVVYPKMEIAQGMREAAPCLYQHNMLRQVDAAMVMQRLCSVFGCDGDHFIPVDDDRNIFSHVWIPQITTAKHTNMILKPNPRYNAQVAKLRSKQPIVLAVAGGRSAIANAPLFAVAITDFVVHYGIPSGLIVCGSITDTAQLWGAKHAVPVEIAYANLDEPNAAEKRAMRMVVACTHYMSFSSTINRVGLQLARMQYKHVTEYE